MTDTVSIASLDKRIKSANEEYEVIKDYDYIIVNDDVEECTVRLNDIIRAESMRVKNNKDIIKKLKED